MAGRSHVSTVWKKFAITALALMYQLLFEHLRHLGSSKCKTTHTLLKAM